MKILSWFLVLAGVAGLVAVRMFEENLFYDPFLQYFKSAYKDEVFPDFAWGNLILGHFFRFLLNFILSLLIVHSLFKKAQWTAQAAALMVIAFAVTFPIYVYCIHTQFEIGYLFSFYIRRFVIQPLVLLLIIPVFYYRKKLMRTI